MAEESEKRFHAVMDKLFFAPPPSPPNSKSKSTATSRSTSASAGGYRKRPLTLTATLALSDPNSKRSTIEELQNASGGIVQSPTCRPWDREDLLKRLATFRSMTWFAKPEVVSAINCARRGWINVDTDTIACESCKARLFFSTPSSWAQQQVEKAASVFSLKLNNGHKLLCPWVDNACDEKLAQFPPSSPPDLVDNYKRRLSSLLQLLELPVISSTAINYMNSPLLQHFLKSPPTLENAYRYNSGSERGFGDESEEVLPVLYYQAQKLISLCGWEPRLLPYIVDCKDTVNHATKDETTPAHNTSITVYSSRTSNNSESNENPTTETEQYDHTSVVLECNLCGAKVGLWAFHTTPRPAEFITLVGHAEPNDENTPARETENTNNPIVETCHVENRNVLTLTIAGGPPPAEQNFRPTISLPVVGQNLRSRFSYAFGTREDEKKTSISNELVEEVGDIIRKNAISGNDKLENVDGKGLNSGKNASEDLAVVETVNPLSSGPACLGKDSKQPSSPKAMEFDPVKQHRHFCPWISSSGKSAPGWKQTLSALERQKEFEYPLATTQPSSSLIEVEDPVGSVKKLLTPPSAKRKKFTH